MSTLGNKEKIQIVFTATLIVVFVIFFLPGKDKGKKTAALTSLATPSAGVTLVAQKAQDGGLFAQLDRAADAQGMKKDPFFGTPILVEEATEKFFLMGIAWDPNKPSAIVNNRIVTVGTQVDGKTVIYIGKDRVILSDGEHNFELLLDL